jgi:hypothetical protein
MLDLVQKALNRVSPFMDRLLAKIGTPLAAFLLWLVTAVVGLIEIYIVREMLLRLAARIWGTQANRQAYGIAVSIGNGATFILAVLWIAVVIGGGEYHVKHLGKRKSWRLFARTIAVELAILILALFI